MTLYDNFHFHNFFRNKEMNEIYVSTGLISFALGLISIFEPIFLYKSGFSMISILIYFLSVSVFFIIFSFFGAKMVSKIGAKHSLLVAIPFMILYYTGLKFAPQYGALFFILPVIKSFKMMFFNYGFHLNFIEHSDQKNRGKEISTIGIANLMASILSPFLGGMILKFYGFPMLVTASSIILFAATIPLFMTRDTHEKLSFNKMNILKNIFRKENFPIISSFSGYAVESWIGFAIWPVFLFIILKNTESIGAVFSFTAFLTFLIFYFIGKKTDTKDKKKLLKLGTILYFFSWPIRIFASNFSSTILIDTYKNITQHIVQIPWSAYSYDIASKGDYFEFIVQREIIFNLSRILIVPILILIFSFNYHPFIISFIIAAVSSLFYAKLSDKAA